MTLRNTRTGMTTPFTRTFPRPAGMGDQCDNFYPNPAYRPDADLPLLLRCQEPATTRLTLLTPDDCYQVKRCDACTHCLRQEVARGAAFEILAEVAL